MFIMHRFRVNNTVLFKIRDIRHFARWVRRKAIAISSNEDSNVTDDFLARKLEVENEIYFNDNLKGPREKGLQTSHRIQDNSTSSRQAQRSRKLFGTVDLPQNNSNLEKYEPKMNISGLYNPCKSSVTYDKNKRTAQKETKKMSADPFGIAELMGNNNTMLKEENTDDSSPVNASESSATEVTIPSDNECTKKLNAQSKPKRRIMMSTVKCEDESDTEDSELNTNHGDVPTYTKLNQKDTTLASFATSAKSKTAREKTGLIMLEGKRLIADAINAGAVARALYFSRVQDIMDLTLQQNDVQLYKIPYKKMSLWSDCATSPGIIGFFKKFEMNDNQKRECQDFGIPLTVICDNVRDPGNMGSILRVAAAVGSSEVILVNGCVDIWDTKVLRSAMGAHFRVPITTNVMWKDLPKFIPNNCKLYLADNNSNYALKDNSTLDISGHKTTFKDLATPYYEADFTNSSVVLVIGGETCGLSNNAFELFVQSNGERINVPLCNGVESLNTGIALAIIAFEIKRQYCRTSVSIVNERHCK